MRLSGHFNGQSIVSQFYAFGQELAFAFVGRNAVVKMDEVGLSGTYALCKRTSFLNSLVRMVLRMSQSVDY